MSDNRLEVKKAPKTYPIEVISYVKLYTAMCYCSFMFQIIKALFSYQKIIHNTNEEAMQVG